MMVPEQPRYVKSSVVLRIVCVHDLSGLFRSGKKEPASKRNLQSWSWTSDTVSECSRLHEPSLRCKAFFQIWGPNDVPAADADASYQLPQKYTEAY